MRHLNFPKTQPPYNPEEWAGVDPRYSHRLEVPTTAPIERRAKQADARRWHYLDNLPVLAERGLEPIGTILCVHGNPTWSYLWRTVLDAGVNERAPWRVVAVNQIDMGFSERTHLDLEGERRSLEDRIADLGDFTKALGLDQTDQPVVTLAHDWGGLISFGWALEHRNLLSGVLLTNTAVYHDGIENIPAALRLALGVHELGTRDSTAFIDVTLGLAQNEGRLPEPGTPGAGPAGGPLPQPMGKQPKRLYPSPLNEAIYRTYRAPYAHPAWREGVRNFVGDIPTGTDVPAYAPMQRIAEQIRDLDVPAFFQWGTKDPVFQRRYLFDLMERMPQAKVHRYEKASHLVAEDYDIAAPIMSWLAQTFGTRGEDGSLVPARNAEAEHRAARARRHGLDAETSAGAASEGTVAEGAVPEAFRPMLAALTERADDTSVAVVDMDPKGDGTTVERDPHLGWAEPPGQRRRGPPSRPGCTPGRPREPHGATRCTPDHPDLRLPEARRGHRRGRHRPGLVGPDPRAEGRQPELPDRYSRRVDRRPHPALAGQAHLGGAAGCRAGEAAGRIRFRVRRLRRGTTRRAHPHPDRGGVPLPRAGCSTRPCCTPPVRPARPRAWCTRSGSWRVCATPSQTPTASRPVAAWWPVLRLLPCWARPWARPA